MKKKKIVDIFIDDIEFPNIGIGYFEGSKVYVKNTIPGQIIKINLLKKRGKNEGRVIEVIKRSEREIISRCVNFGICGGCTYQNISYEYELELKEKMILDLFRKNNIKYDKYIGIEGSITCDGYRNKMEFSFGDEEKDGLLSLGMRKRNSYYEVVTSDDCKIIDEDYKKILLSVLKFFREKKISFYHKGSHKGCLRHLIVRKGFYTKEILINLVTTSMYDKWLDEFVDIILKLDLSSKIVGILHTINDSIADVVKVDKLNILYGRDWYTEELIDLKFKVPMFAFFQTNSKGAEQLYSTVKNFVGNNNDKVIFDLYCGTGTIGQLLSKNAKKVICIDIVDSAIKIAIRNAELNCIKNCKFILGDVLKEVDNLVIKPDIIILDPPREGIHPKSITKIINFNADKIIYISCKVTSLIRDLEIFLKQGYILNKFKIHDMFPRTYHLEVVVLLEKV